MYRICIVLTVAVLWLNACRSLPVGDRRYNIPLYSRGIDRQRIGNLRLSYSYQGLNYPDNLFRAELFTIPRPIEKIQVPGSPELTPVTAARKRRYSPAVGKSYTKIQRVIREAKLIGRQVYRIRTRQPFRNRDTRLLERLLLISDPGSLGNILCIEFLLYPSRRGYLLRVDLRPATDFNKRIPQGTPVDQVANILSASEEAALFHNQTVIGADQYF